MANKHSLKNKKKHKKEKSKKHKKEKHRKHKKEKSKHSSDSSESSCSDSEKSLKDFKLENSNKPEWDFLDTVLCDSNVTVKTKKEKMRRPSPERPGQSVRELNPYWKDGCSGLPPAVEDKLTNVQSATGSNSSFNSDYSCSRKKIYNNIPETYDSKKSKPSFLKPGDKSNFSFNNATYTGNWKKKNITESKKEEMITSTEIKDKEISHETKSLSNEELNKLASKLVKAEIMGNITLINKLKAELEAAKRNRTEPEDKIKEVVIVTGSTLKKPYSDNKDDVPSKKRKVRTHDSTGRVCYFPDDDKYSLKNLFVKEKTASEEEILIPSKLAEKNQDDFDDVYLEAAASYKMQQKIEDRKIKKATSDAVVKHKTLEGCRWCLDNRNETKHLIVSTGNKCYLCLPEEESLSAGHCLIVPFQHEISTMHLDEDVWSEIKTYQRVLSQMFLKKEQDVVFFENARSFKYFPHCFIQCVPLCKEMGDVAPIYFQKAISESETEWSNNKKVIDFRHKDLRQAIPKGLPYFAISFGTEGGFAHIIEDEFLFKKNFAEEVLGGMLDLEPRKWRKPQKENFRTQREKALEFLKIWKKFEFNKNASDSDSCSSD